MQRSKRRVYPRKVLVDAANRWLRGDKLISIALDLGMHYSYVHALVYAKGTAYRWKEFPRKLIIMLLEKQESRALAALERVRERLFAAHLGEDPK
jgi:hypothetical protein